MSVFKITDNIYSVGVLNPNLRVFDIVMSTEYGTSYNSYIIKGQKNVLVETCHHSFFEEYLDNISAVVDPASIDYIILNHTEPDHSGALAKLMEICVNAQIICSRAASIYLKGITNRTDLNIKTPADSEVLDLGDRTLKFISAPFLHWPDSMFTWCEEEKTLFSCDFFGSHYCEPRMIDKHVTYENAYNSALKNYYDAIFGPFPTYVAAGLSKIADLDIANVCTSHGPVLTKDGKFDYVKDCYENWSVIHKNEHKTIPIFYCSAYGNTKKAAEIIKSGILSVIPDAVVNTYDIIKHDMAFLAGELAHSDAFVIGSPTLNRDAVAPVWQLLSHIDAINIIKRPCAVFGSFGWSGEAVGNITGRLNMLKCNVFAEGIKFNFVPSEDDAEKIKSFGEEFAKSL